MCNSAISVWLQSAVGSPDPLPMVSLRHMKTQLRELRFFSGVTQSLCKLREWEQCVHQMGGGVLTQLLLNAMVRRTVLACKLLQCWHIQWGLLVPIKHCTVNWMGLQGIFFQMHSILPHKLKRRFHFTSFRGTLSHRSQLRDPIL